MAAQIKAPKIILFLSCLLCSAPAAAAPSAKAELIDGGEAQGARFAGLRIELSAGAMTYWRDPGEAGVAPTFDFSASQNLAGAEALFPQPQRLEEAGAQVFGYTHDVILPLRLTAKDPSKPIGLALSVDYAVCEKLCLPIHETLKLDLPAAGSAAPGFAEALAKIPRRLDAAETEKFARLAPAPARDGKKLWRLSLAAPGADLLVEAPEGFFVESRRDGEGFELTLAEHPAKQDLPEKPLRLTLTGEHPLDFLLSLK